MKVALCLGGADCVQDDWEAALDLFKPAYVIAANHVGFHWPHHLDAWVTLHPEHITRWRETRLANGYSDADEYLLHGNRLPEWCSQTGHMFPGMALSGSSGMMAAKVALCDFGADKVVLAGIPLLRQAHFFGAHDMFDAAGTYREAWQTIPPIYRARMRSMSGWTADFLGRPDKEWLGC